MTIAAILVFFLLFVIINFARHMRSIDVDKHIDTLNQKINELDTYYYFAYGSNMDVSRLEKRTGPVKTVGTGKLSEYKFEFNSDSKGAHAFANVTYTGNSEDFVEGVVYKLTKKQFDTLHMFEGLGVVYNLGCDNDIIEGLSVWFYVNTQFLTTEKGPSEEYLDYIKKGVEQLEIIKQRGNILEEEPIITQRGKDHCYY